MSFTASSADAQTFDFPGETALVDFVLTGVTTTKRVGMAITTRRIGVIREGRVSIVIVVGGDDEDDRCCLS